MTSSQSPAAAFETWFEREIPEEKAWDFSNYELCHMAFMAGCSEHDRLTAENARLLGAVSEIEAHLRSGDENGAYLIACAALPKETT